MKREPFERVVERHGPTVLRVCRAVVGPAVAEDAWSETFLAALTAYPDLPPGSNVEAWLVTIAHRKSIDQLRQAARRPAPLLAAAGDHGHSHGHSHSHSHELDPPEPPDQVDELALGHAIAQGLEGHQHELAAPPHGDATLDPWPAVLALPLRQRQAVAYHHVAGLPYRDVATILGCSPVAARRAAADGIATLRTILQPQEQP